MSRIALITGATSGIGKATAEAFANEGIQLILCGRRQDRLNELQTLLGSKVKVLTLQFDVRDREAVFQAIESLPTEWQAIDILVNNAGNAHGLSPIQDGNPDDWDAMLDINVKGLLYVSKAVMPLMKLQRKGHIVNLSSIAGKQTYPNGNVYCASKAAVEALSEGMRLDLNPFGIKVTNIAPGAVETEFSLVRFKGDQERSANVYKGFTPLTAHDIANVITYTINQPAHVVLADITIFPIAQASTTLLRRE
ncbi:MAG: SDR family NAD(P)-dependent oxidoreductase [Spirosomataceae bacterium]